jgi:7-cyano-7-deazaguanine synthase in queuosine biosynthesis
MINPSDAAAKSTKKNSVCLLMSGGIVSLALLDYYSKQFPHVIPVYIHMGFRWEECELYWLKKYLRGHKGENLEALEILHLPLRDSFQSHWSVTGVKTPTGKEHLKDIYLPGRDLVMLNKAAIFSAAAGSVNLAVGFLKSHSMISRGNDTLARATELISKSLEVNMNILTPFATKNREDALFIMKDQGYEYSFSCLSPKGYQHCGECYKCHERKISFFKTGITDKTQYYKSLLGSAVTTAA